MKRFPVIMLLILTFQYSNAKGINNNIHPDSVLIMNTSTATFSSNLPIVLINTNKEKIVDEPKKTATMQIVYNGEGVRNKITDQTFDYNGFIGIELRGNSTQKFEKKPYSVETRDEAGNNLNVEILGMPKENDWVFRASYLDRSFLRNTLAHHLSMETGRWSSRFRYCELFINEEYMGIYIILEKIKRDKNRLDIAVLPQNETNIDSITGGYIYEITGFHNDFGENRRIKYPKLKNITNSQLNYIRNYDDMFRSIMVNPDWSKRKTIYDEWIDMHSFVDEMIVQEAMRNSDAYGWSAYFHKDKNGPLKAGPVWDFDQAGGNSTYNQGDLVSGWVFEIDAFPNPDFWRELFQDSVFKYIMKVRWQRYRRTSYSDLNVNHFIDSISNLLDEAQKRNFEKWPILGIEMWRDTPGWQSRYRYSDYVNHLKDYMRYRMNWIDNEMKNVPVLVEFDQKKKTYNQFGACVYPNPVERFLYLKIDAPVLSDFYLTFTSYSGKIIKETKIQNIQGDYITSLNIEPLNDGIYFLQVTDNRANNITLKVVKK